MDFGTTNSAIAFYDGDEARIIPNAEGARTTPSVVAIAEDGSILVGTAAQRQDLTNPAYTARSVKLRLGTGWTMTRGAVTLTAQQVATLILRKLREDAEVYLGVPVRRAIVTVPANFDRIQRDALAVAAEAAGVRVMRMLSEPTAAAMALNSDTDDRNVLVFDLGGGTLDVSLLTLGDGIVDTRTTSGNSRLGGDDWDRALVEHLVARVRARHGVDLTQDVAAMRRLREAAETAKTGLSSASAADIRLPYLTVTTRGPLHFEHTVGRAEFEHITRHLQQRCTALVERVLAEAGVTADEIDQVVLTGGATRMPMIGDLVHRATGGKPVHRGIIPEGVVVGAALQGGVISGRVKDVLLLDVSAFSAGFATADGTAVFLIERDTTIPTGRHEFVCTTRDRQDRIVAHFVERGTGGAEVGETLAVLELTGLAPTPGGRPRAQVVVDVDINGALWVSIRELRFDVADQREFSGRLRTYVEPNNNGPDRTHPLAPHIFTGREVGIHVSRSVIEQARLLVRSRNWRPLSNDRPVLWKDPADPSSIN
ncbi:Hsp70 family protein [Yinghuangia seranimata]|nr:Hsp70 family protein [Yinghuangia seranimata]MDI2125012.1 Hsp70 family protein [Yinghuangia seranimata]